MVRLLMKFISRSLIKKVFIMIEPTISNFMNGVSVKQIKPVNADDPKGLTYELFKGIHGMQVTYCTRNAEKIFGDHYHRGDDPSKNPERVVLLSGSCAFIACNGVETEIHFLNQTTLEIIIQPSVIHAFFPRENISFIEYRSTVYNHENNDTFTFGTFKTHLEMIELPINNPAISNYQKNIFRYKL